MSREEGEGHGGPARAGRIRPRLPMAVCIGASAGGPRALLTLLAHLKLPAPVFALVVQHIHPKFTGILVRRLAEVSLVPVVEAEDQAIVEPGKLYVAPGGRHLVVEVVRPLSFRTRLTETPPRNGVRPSVDELFVSVAAAFGARAVGVVLTGMGHDGQEGARAIKARGGAILAEAEESCVVYGMPRALSDAGLADRLVPIDEMATAVRQACLAILEPGAPVTFAAPG